LQNRFYDPPATGPTIKPVSVILIAGRVPNCKIIAARSLFGSGLADKLSFFEPANFVAVVAGAESAGEI
jgi:hypothetical protein